MASSDKKTTMVRLLSSDGEAFDVSEDVIAAASATIKAMIKEGYAADDTATLPIPNVTAATLSRVLNYVNKHFDPAVVQADDYYLYAPDDDHPLADFDNEFIDVDNDTLIDLVTAAECLRIDKLFELTCKALADKMRGRGTDEIRKMFGIVNDYTKEEEEEVRRENSWAFPS